MADYAVARKANASCGAQAHPSLDMKGAAMADHRDDPQHPGHGDKPRPAGVTDPYEDGVKPPPVTITDPYEDGVKPPPVTITDPYEDGAKPRPHED